MPRLGGGLCSARAAVHGDKRHQRRGVRSEGETLIVVWGALGLWLVLIVLVLAALRAAALADREQERRARSRRLEREQERRTRRRPARSGSHTAAVLVAVA